MEHAADPDLVRDAKRGDEAAFTSLLRPLLEPAYRLAAAMLQDRQLAEDPVQEAAVKAWRKMQQLREGTEVRPWFLGIVANECRTTRRGRWWGVLKIDAERTSAESPDDAAVQGVDLRNALKRLRPDQRLVVVLYFYLDLPLEEVANIAGASLAAVRGRLYRGIRELGAGFSNHGAPSVTPEDALRSDIHQALDPIASSTPELLPRIVQRLRPVSRRRSYFAIGQVAAVLGILIVGAVVFSMHRSRVTPATVTTSPTAPIVAGPGADIAWVTSQQVSGGTYTGDLVTGIDPTGHVVGRIDARDELRSPDGSHLYALTDGGVDVYSATDGHREQTIRLQPVTSGQPMLSADGHYLAVVGNSPSTLQLGDLLAGRSVASTNGSLPAYGVPLIIGVQAQHVYVVGATIAKFAFDGTSFLLEQRPTSQTIT